MNKGDNTYTYTSKIVTQIISEQEKLTMEVINDYCKKNNYIPNLISEENLKEVLELGIARKTKVEILQSQLEIANKKLEKLDNEIKSVINIIKQQPSNDDEWILGRLNGFLSIIGKESNKDVS